MAEVLEDRCLLTVFVVNDDGGGDHLAIQDAIDAAVAGDTILIDGGADRIHTEQGVTIDKNVTILGSDGNEKVIVQGTGSQRVFFIASGATVRLEKMQIRNGSSGFDDGGAIFNEGNAVLNEMTLSNNSSFVIVVICCGGGSGGAIANTGTMLIENSTIAHNRACRSGGGLQNSGILEIRNSTISSNSGSSGAGIANSGMLTIANSTITQNSIVAVIGRSQISFGEGGGISTLEGSTSLQSTIVIGNRGLERGLLNTTRPISSDIDGAIDVAENNLVGDSGTSGVIRHGTDGNLVGNAGEGKLDLFSVIDPILANNGGQTLTHNLVFRSPAIDAGSNPHNLLFDQRGLGFPRIIGIGTDIGAVEFIPPPFPTNLIPVFCCRCRDRWRTACESVRSGRS